MNELHQDRTIVKTIIEMDKGLGIKTVAEGVESPETLELLKYLGCNYSQGFFGQKP